MLVDSHCHLDCLDLSIYQHKLDLALQDAQQHGVEYFLCIAVDMPSAEKVHAIAAEYSMISASVGVHPTEHAEVEPTVKDLVDFIKMHPKVVALGETGLDYYHPDQDIVKQQERFRTHIRAARETGKPLIVHTREARADTLKILREENATEVGGVLHCFTENWEMAEQAMELNFSISFSGIVTFKNALELKEIAKRVPLERMLIETDAPYLAPVPMRGKPNQPAYVRYVAEYLAELRNISLADLAQYTTSNFYQLFKIKPLINPY